MRYFFFALILFLGVDHASKAQTVNYYPDSIRIELPDQKTIAIFELRAYKNKPDFIRNFPAFLKELLVNVEKSSPEGFADAGPHKIDIRLLPEGQKEILSSGSEVTYKPLGEKTLITIRPMGRQETHVTVKEKQIVELLPPGWELSIQSKEVKVNLYAESFRSLLLVADLNFNEIADKLTKEIDAKPLGKSSIRSRMIFRENKIDQSAFARKYPGDNIFLTATAGVGLFRDKLYPQLSLHLGLTFNDHFGRRNIRTSLVYDNLIFAEKIVEGYQTNVNSFLSLSFEKNFNYKSKATQWTGIGAGFLVRKNGDYFTGNTAKIFIIHEMENRRISLQPEFYLTDDFKKFAFGMTLRYTF
jgi:hypothetical protein